MSEHHTIYDSATGRIRACLVGGEELAGINLQPGESLLAAPSDPDRDHVVDGAVVARADYADRELVRRRGLQMERMRAHAGAAIRGTFVSEALGAPHRYPNGETDQLTRLSALLVGAEADLMCADSTGSWARRRHDTAALHQVVRDSLDHIARGQRRWSEMAARIDAGPDAASIEQLQWDSKK